MKAADPGDHMALTKEAGAAHPGQGLPGYRVWSGALSIRWVLTTDTASRQVPNPHFTNEETEA